MPALQGRELKQLALEVSSSRIQHVVHVCVFVILGQANERGNIGNIWYCTQMLLSGYAYASTGQK